MVPTVTKPTHTMNFHPIVITVVVVFYVLWIILLMRKIIKENIHRASFKFTIVWVAPAFVFSMSAATFHTKLVSMGGTYLVKDSTIESLDGQYLPSFIEENEDSIFIKRDIKFRGQVLRVYCPYKHLEETEELLASIYQANEGDAEKIITNMLKLKQVTWLVLPAR